ncbi:GNAT family N-acetyltransferase [Hathewaya limosa]|uniref:Ribosomal-protein-alanine N-acetyltransferase n=1 Tax=Hathewaya limosa TaxID=1536 RepID=A0ABU0JYN6_HATLI|nr:GNAT family protein [Hathewaya limosa]MDQ0481017.1 ribosomal-protein-alanine N-acetyltransferase [Hathewaya limosa]
MGSEKNLITIEQIKGNENEYVLKDNVGINIGRIFIVDKNIKNKYMLIRIKLYKESNGLYDLLSELIDSLLYKLFWEKKICKLNLLVNQDFDFLPIIEKGFELEGVLKDNIYINRNEYKSEFLFGITDEDYKKSDIKSQHAIKGKHIELRILTPDYSNELLNYCIRNRKHLEMYEPHREERYFTIDAQQSYLIESYKGYLNGREVNFGVFKQGKLIGKIRVTNITLGVFRNCTVGYSMDEMEQGKGYMKEALNLTIEYIFDVLQLHRIEASTLLDNVRSQAVLKACGFKELGINEKYLFINGEWKDHKTFYKTFNWSE